MAKDAHVYETLAEREAREKSEKAAPALAEALRGIAQLGGQLDDVTIEQIGGINDGRSRALMYSQARQIARAALRDTGLEE